MKMDLRHIARYELIGLEAEVTDSKNKDNIGIKGKIKDETKNTVIIENKKLLKNNITLKIKIKNQTIIVPGTEILGRPKERITK